MKALPVAVLVAGSFLAGGVGTWLWPALAKSGYGLDPLRSRLVCAVNGSEVYSSNPHPWTKQGNEWVMGGPGEPMFFTPPSGSVCFLIPDKLAEVQHSSFEHPTEDFADGYLDKPI